MSKLFLYCDHKVNFLLNSR